MVKRVTEPFAVWRDGMPATYTAGMLVDDKDPILKTHKHLFEDVSAAVKSRPSRGVEQATADPGEPRSITPPVVTEQTERQPSAAEGDGDAEPFDPAEHSAPEVLAYLDGADPDEIRRVLDAEESGQGRKGITGKRGKLLDEG